MNKEMKLIPELRFPEFQQNEEWAEKPLKSLAKITMGSSPKSASYNENKIGLPLLQGNADIKDRLSAPRIYTSEITKECEIGDILLSVRAPVGTIAKSIHHACIGRGISGIRAEKNNSQEFLYQWLFSFESAWKNISQGGTFDAVNSDDIRNLLVPTPQPQEQQKIASCLSSLDELLAAHNDKLQALKDHKKGLMQNLFPHSLNHDSKGLTDDHDFDAGKKSRNQANQKNHSSDNVPKVRFPEFEEDGEWTFTILNEIADISSGGTPSRAKKEYWNGNIPWVSTTLIDFNEIKKANEFITDLGLKNSSTKIFPKGTILMAMYGQGKTRGKVAVLDFDATINQACAAIKLNLGTSINFVFQNLASRYDEIRSISNQGGQDNLSGELVKNIPICYPKNELEQRKIASCLSAVDELITAQADKIEQLMQHKKGLMQGLFPKN